MPVRRAGPNPPLAARRPATSRLLKQPCPDLLPRDHVGGILPVPPDPVVEFRALRFRKRDIFGLQAFPQKIRQFDLLPNPPPASLVPQIPHVYKTPSPQYH